MGDISLTSGMRANLLSLQSSVKLLDRTQERLATGKKVNTALDNPVNFFTAQSHTSRASDLLSFKDGISESIQTIKAADTAITGITALINSAKAVAEAAKGAISAGSGGTTQTLTINSVTNITAGATINIGGTTFRAVASGATASTDFNIGTTTSTMAISIAQKINEETPDTITSATVSGNVITITSSRTMVATDIVFAPALSVDLTESSITSTTELSSKVTQYATLMTQLDNLKADAYYKGKNLLSSGDNMTVRFGNNHTLVVNAFDGTRSGLGMDASLTATSEATIQATIDKLDAALSTLRVESSNLSGNLSIVNARDEWITSIAATLQTGADKLTLADANEEGANMLMLQTRQALSTSALSMSAQAAQSVLRLFQ